MLNPEYPNFEKKSLDDLDLALSEPIKKINIRGKKMEFLTTVGKMLSIILRKKKTDTRCQQNVVLKKF